MNPKHDTLLNEIEADLGIMLGAFNSVNCTTWCTSNKPGGPLFISHWSQRTPDCAIRIMIATKFDFSGYRPVGEYIRLDWWGWPTSMKNPDLKMREQFPLVKTPNAPRGSAFNFKRATHFPGQADSWKYNSDALVECVKKHLLKWLQTQES